MPLELVTDDGSAVEDYTLYSFTSNRAVYHGPAHSDLHNDYVIVTSDNPKRNSSSYGNRRSTIKYIRSVTVNTPDGGTDIRDAKTEISVSLPVGTPELDLGALFRKLRGIQDYDLEWKPIVVSGQTQF